MAFTIILPRQLYWCPSFRYRFNTVGCCNKEILFSNSQNERRKLLPIQLSMKHSSKAL